MSRAFAQKLLAHARAHSLFRPGDRVLLAVSGGADSTAMLRLFHETLARPLKLNLGVAHFNHGFRGHESDRDESFVRNLAGQLGLPFHAGRGRNILRKGDSPEARAREARYRFLLSTAKRHGYDCAATAHHLDDQAETVLMRVLKGAPLSGLAAIRPRNGIIVRPLLCLRRHELLAYLKTKAQPFRTDRSNRNLNFLRNRIRNRIIPFLEKEINPSLTLTLARLADRARDCSPGPSASLGDRAMKSIPWSMLPSRTGKNRKNRTTTAVPERSRGADVLPTFKFPLKSGLHRGPDHFRVRIRLTSPSKPGPFPAAYESRAFLDFDKLAPRLSLGPRKPGDRFFPLGAPGPSKLKSFMINEKIPEALRASVPLLRSGDDIAWVAGHRVSERYKVGPSTRKIAIINIEI